jgi:hypothetical protein
VLGENAHCDTAPQRSPGVSNLALNDTYLARCSKTHATWLAYVAGKISVLREATEMAFTPTLSAIPHMARPADRLRCRFGWAVLVPLVLVGNVVVASFAWWLVGLI